MLWIPHLCILFFVLHRGTKQRRAPSRTTAPRASAGANTPPIPPPLSMPVWSLATPSLRPNPSTAMNIVTFASAVSVAAPKLWMISLYYDTLTKDSFCQAQHGVLQLLSPVQKDLVPILGKRSGYEKDYSKEQACRAAGMTWVHNHEMRLDPNNKPCFALLPDCASYLHVKLKSTVHAGDHLVTICELIRTGVWDAEEQTVKQRSDSVGALDHHNVLYTGLLRQEGII